MRVPRTAGSNSRRGAPTLVVFSPRHLEVQELSISHQLPLSFQSSQFLVLRSVLCHWDGDLSSEGHWDAQMCIICAAPSVGGPWAAEQKPGVVSTQQVPLAPVTTSSRGMEAGKWTSWPAPASSAPLLIHCPRSPATVHGRPYHLSIITPPPSCSTRAAVILSLSGSQESGSSSILFKLLFMTKTL